MSVNGSGLLRVIVYKKNVLKTFIVIFLFDFNYSVDLIIIININLTFDFLLMEFCMC